MFNFFEKNRRNTSLEWIGVDIHSHLLPGIDDGSPDVETSVFYIRSLLQLGLSKFICTPHIFKELYPNTRATIEDALLTLQTELVIHDIPVVVSAAAEYMIDPDFDTVVSQGDFLVMNKKYMLIEMPFLFESPRIDHYITYLLNNGYQPILAHPERYHYYHDDYNKYQHVKELGCLLQVNILSFSGYYGKEVKRIAFALLKEGILDLIATDLHHQKQLSELIKYVKSGRAYEELGRYPFRNKELFEDLPETPI